jgi:2'-5' RNA ligase
VALSQGAFERKSAIIVPVPDAERAVGDIRRLFDPSAAVGVPAHITLIHPFYPAPVPEETIHELEQFFASAVPIVLRFESVGRFSNTLYLEPTPAGSLIALTEALAERWPQWPPYSGEHRDIVPHLTVADQLVDRARLETLAASVASRLPLSTTVTEAWLIESDPDGLWHGRSILPFRRDGAPV